MSDPSQLIPESLRTGLAGEVHPSEASAETLETVAALLRVFAKDAMTVAGRYTHAHGRMEVTGGDMRVALMYCARMFFQDTPEDEMTRLVDEEREAMREEDEEEDGDGESQGEDGYGTSEGASGDSDSEGDQDDDDDRGFGSGDVDEEDVRLARKVDAIAISWPHWRPDDPVSQLLKRAIDQTPVA